MNIYLALGYYKSERIIEIFGFEIDKSKCEEKLADLLKLDEFNGIAGTIIVEFGDEENSRRDIGTQIGDWLYEIVGCPEEEIQDTIYNIRRDFGKALIELGIAPNFPLFAQLMDTVNINSSIIMKPEDTARSINAKLN